MCLRHAPIARGLGGRTTKACGTRARVGPPSRCASQVMPDTQDPCRPFVAKVHKNASRGRGG
eukprot:6448709-Pyramimonas_sp.AAC.1